MKRALFAMVFLVFFLSACGPSGPTPTPTPDPADVAMQVMLLLTTEPIVIPTLPPPPTPEPTLAATNTPEGPTPTATGTEPPTLTPTLKSSDPKASLGDPTWKETFNRGKTSFYTFDDGHTQISLVNDYLKMTSLASNSWTGWSLNGPKPKNMYLEGTFLTETCDGLDRYGLVFRAPDFESAYFFGVSCDGQYNFRVYNQQGDLVGWTKDDAILAGSNQKNVLGVMAEGTHIKLYINGEMVKELEDSTYTDSGLFGVFIAAQRTPGFTVKVDEVDYWLK